MSNLLLVFILILFGSPRDLNEKGNKLYHHGEYKEALQKYKKAQVKDPKNMIIDYNIGCGQYKTSVYKDALQSFTRIVSSLEDKKLKEKAVYNLGNVIFKSGDLEGSIEMYKQALRMNPNDIDAKINLEFAQKMLQESQKQKQENKNENKQNEKQQQNQQDKQKQDKKEQNKEQQKEEKSKQQEQKMSQESARNILEALQQDEKNVSHSAGSRYGGTQSKAKNKKGHPATAGLKDW